MATCFRRWRDIEDLNSCADLNGKTAVAGIYKIRLADRRGQPIPLGRFLAQDTEGLLAIGESNSVARRLREFRTEPIMASSGIPRGRSSSSLERLPYSRRARTGIPKSSLLSSLYRPRPKLRDDRPSCLKRTSRSTANFPPSTAISLHRFQLGHLSLAITQLHSRRRYWSVAHSERWPLFDCPACLC